MSTNTERATARRWEWITGEPTKKNPIIYHAINEVVLLVEGAGPDERRAVAATFVRAVNAHEKLVEALRVMVDHAQEQYPHFESERGRRDISAAKAALNLAEGE